MTVTAEPQPAIAFDADVLIYAAIDGHELGGRVLSLIAGGDPSRLRGSTMLIAELLIKPTRDRSDVELAALQSLLGRLELSSATAAVCELAVTLGAKYRLATIDAVHLATAVDQGSDAFLTNNRKDFDPDSIEEIDVVFPDELSP